MDSSNSMTQYDYQDVSAAMNSQKPVFGWFSSRLFWRCREFCCSKVKGFGSSVPVPGKVYKIMRRGDMHTVGHHVVHQHGRFASLQQCEICHHDVVIHVWDKVKVQFLSCWFRVAPFHVVVPLGNHRQWGFHDISN